MQEPNWISLTTPGSDYEEELDVYADPNASDKVKMRHRHKSFTGQSFKEWKPGSAPAR